MGHLADGRTVAIRVTDHAIDRYHERVKPHLDRAVAAAELAALVAMCPVREGPAAWVRSPQRAFFHVDVGTVTVAADPDPFDPGRLMARTVLTQGCFSRRRRGGGGAFGRPL